MAVVDQVARQQIQQIGVPRFVFHLVNRLHETAPEEARPEPVHNRATEPAVIRAGHRLGQLPDASGLVRLGINLAQLGMNESHVGNLAGRLVALDHLKRLVRVHTRERIGICQRPVVDEAVVARGALEIHAHENLRDVLGRLHLRFLAGVHHAPPDDALGEPLRVLRGIDQVVHEIVVRLVVEKRSVQPAGDLLATAVDVARPGVVVAQDIIPKRQPMLGVRLAISKQSPNQLAAFLRVRVRHERLEFLHRRQQADRVEINAPGKNSIRDHPPGIDIVLREVRLQQTVDRVAPFRPWQLRPVRLQVQYRRLGEVCTLLPLESLIDPGPHQTDLFRGEFRALLRHHVVGVDPGHQLDEITSGAVAQHHRLPGVSARQQLFARLEAEPTLGLALAVALCAALLEQRKNFLSKTDLMVGSRRQLRLLLVGQLSPNSPG